MMKIKNKPLLLLIGIILYLGLPVTAQTIDENITITAENSSQLRKERAGYIMINTDYPLVPGDTFTLAYSQRGQNVSMSFFVEEDFTVNLTYLGEINVKGLTFADLKEKIGIIVEDSFPGSYSRLVITSPGAFMVPVRGETRAAVEIPAWGFMKLSSALDGLTTPYTSTRKVEVLSQEGESRIYDLYQAFRFGDSGSDPFLRVGDTIILHKHERMISVEGEVRRPGIYELLPGEDLESILNIQADGFNPMADPERVHITRMLSESSRFGESIYIDLSESIPGDFDLENMDVINVPLRADFQPVVYFQGAIGRSAAGTTVSNKIPIAITPGEKLLSATRRVQEEFNLVSDLSHALLSRIGEEKSIGINLEELMLKGNPEDDIVLEDGDIIVIPFRQYQVYVGGQVRSPGMFPYIPNRSWEYYVGLAGGFNIDNHIGTKVKITDIYGEKHKQDERIIQPEDIIYAPLNHPMYWIGEYGTDIAVIISSIASTVALINFMGKVADDTYEPLPIPSTD